MNIFQEYKKYLKDNPKHYWFKRKLYGWGWTPATWEGWLVLLVWIVVLAAIFIRVDYSSHSVSDTLIGIFIPEILSIAILIGICYWKGEKPRWQWGLEDAKKKDKES